MGKGFLVFEDGLQGCFFYTNYFIEKYFNNFQYTINSYFLLIFLPLGSWKMIDLLKRQHIPDYLLTDILIAPPDVPVFPVVGCESELFGH
jgi:hypothetical protein